MICAPGGGVEVAGRLVGEEQPRARHERARERDALLLAARELLRIVMQALAEADALEHLRARPGAPRALPASSSGSITFSSAVSAGSSWKDWNTKPDEPRAQRGAPVLVEREEIVAVELHAARVGVSRPASSPSSVDLPEPEAPTTATASPRADLETYVRREWSAPVAPGAARACRVPAAFTIGLVADRSCHRFMFALLSLLVRAALPLSRCIRAGRRRSWSTATASPPATGLPQAAG